MPFSSDKTRQGAAGVSTGYDIPYSCRFENSDAGTYLSKTYGSDGNRRTWTFSGWFKRGTKRNRGITEGWGNNHIFSPLAGGHGSQNECWMMIIETGYLWIQDSAGVAGYMGHKTGAAYFDVANWYHIVVACDTTQAAEANRMKLWINGVQETQFLSQQHQTQNNYTGWGAATLHTLGSYATTKTAANSWKGYLAECHFLDGVAITANSFGEFGDYGEWKPKEYAVADGAYGTNGFYLNFSNASDLGEDFSGNNNDYATVSGVGGGGFTDSPAQSLDSPTNNFCTLDPMRTTVCGTGDQINYGNLQLWINNGGNTILSAGTFAVTSGKWYWEAIADEIDGNDAYTQPEIGLIGVSDEVNDGTAESDRTLVYKTTYDYEGVTDNLSGATFATYAEDDIIGVAYNADDDEITFYKNNVAQTTTSLQATDSQGMQPLLTGHYGNGSSWVANFGQDSSFSGRKTSGSAAASDDSGYGDFYYTPPSGFLVLCAKNLPEPAVIPSEHFDVALYIGNGSTQNITSLGFQPDFTWIKNRQTTDQHQLFDAVRGVTKTMTSAESDAETTNDDTLTHFLSNGFTTGDDVVTNTDTEYYVSWNWKANGSGSANTVGDLDSTVSVNADAGFSIVKYVGDQSSAQTVGHGLGVVPEMIIVKNTSRVKVWAVYHKAIGNTHSLDLSTSAAALDSNIRWNDTTPTSTLFTIGTSDETNYTGDNHIAYCFKSIEGYSKVGHYEGNAGGGYNGEDGPFINLGFRPKFIIIKTADDTDAWVMYDSERGWRLNANRRNYFISPDVESAETEHGAAKSYAEFFSNGVKIRDDDNLVNKNGDTYIYIAFADLPFKYSNAGHHTQGYHADNNPP
tara:strand:+ start:309 stop:2864 length:2556 start_codon:yes stop_codon:yes gene_type:complete